MNRNINHNVLLQDSYLYEIYDLENLPIWNIGRSGIIIHIS